MRKFLSLSFALALFVPLAACGGGEDEDSSSSSGSASSEEEETTTTEEQDDDDGGSNGDSEYCEVVDEVLELDEALGDDDIDFNDDDTVELLVDALEELRDNVDDDDIADDFGTMIEGFETLAEAVQDAGGDEDAELEVFTDPEFEDLFLEFAAAGERIDEFTLDECGVTLDGETETESSGSGSGSGSSSGEDTSLEDFADDVEACEDGDMAVCDQLFLETPIDSEAETVGATCGGRSEERVSGQCETLFG